MREKQNIFLCEGNSDAALLKALSISGKIFTFNIWETPLSKIERRLTKDSHVYVLYDSDLANRGEAKLTCFSSNVNKLQRNNSGFVLKGFLQQTGNLEEELLYACNNISSLKKLESHFGAAGQTQLKSLIISCGEQLAKKLSDAGFDPDLLWQRPTIDELLNRGIELKKRLHYSDLPQKSAH